MWRWSGKAEARTTVATKILQILATQVVDLALTQSRTKSHLPLRCSTRSRLTHSCWSLKRRHKSWRPHSFLTGTLMWREFLQVVAVSLTLSQAPKKWYRHRLRTTWPTVVPHQRHRCFTRCQSQSTRPRSCLTMSETCRRKWSKTYKRWRSFSFTPPIANARAIVLHLRLIRQSWRVLHHWKFLKWRVFEPN